jgi:uncharacterized membrane protein
VRILADSGIHERAGQKEWEADVALIVAGMRRRDPVQGIGSAVDRIGDLLAEFFPRAADDQNELSDEVLRLR